MSTSFVIVGLGNPGPKYSLTPHNAGFLVIDELAKRWRLEGFQEKFHAHFAKCERNGESHFVLKPNTFMNRSGLSVGEISRFFKIPSQQVLVISDDIDLDAGVLRLRLNGGPGGHNGLKSVIEGLGTEDFPRLRIGVGRSPVLPPDEFVLAKVPSEQWPEFQNTIGRAADGVEHILREGVAKAMNTVNQKEKTP